MRQRTATADPIGQLEQSGEYILEEGRSHTSPFVADIQPEAGQRGDRLGIPAGTLASPRRCRLDCDVPHGPPRSRPPRADRRARHEHPVTRQGVGKSPGSGARVGSGEVACEWSGPKGLSVFLDTYQGPLPGAKTAAAAKLNSAW